MADDKQYYVKLSFEFGVDNEDGTFIPKNTGVVDWVSMKYDNATGLQTYAIIPALNDMMTKAGELGLMATGMIPFPEGMEDTSTKTTGNTKTVK